jgi:hypothetical protein
MAAQPAACNCRRSSSCGKQRADEISGMVAHLLGRLCCCSVLPSGIQAGFGNKRSANCTVRGQQLEEELLLLPEKS